MPGYEVWYKPILDWSSQLTFWDWVGVIYILFVIAFLFNAMVRWRTYFGEPMEFTYEFGYPGVEGPLDGEFELVGPELYFKDIWRSNHTHFQIPLKQISKVSKDTSWFTLLHLHFPYLLFRNCFPVFWQDNVQRNDLIITFCLTEGGKEQILRFRACSHSKALLIWYKRLKAVLAVAAGAGPPVS